MNGSSIWSKAFWQATGERAISTGSQALLLAWGGGALPDVSLPWWTLPLAFLGGGALTVFKCMAAVGRNGTASLTASEDVAPPTPPSPAGKYGGWE